MYPIWAYFLPCNHRKACRETKWTIRDRAPFASSKQICISIDAPLTSRTLCMVRDGKWATTHNSTLFGPEVHPYFLPGLTLVFDTDCFLKGWKAPLVPKQLEVHPNSSGSTNDLREWSLKDVCQLPDGPKQVESCHCCLHTLLFRSTRPTIAAVMHRNCTAWNWGSVRHSTISSQFPSYFVQQGAEKCVFGCTEQAHGECFKY